MISTAQATRTLRQTADSSREVVESHPASAALTAFGVGLGVGVAIGLMLTDSASQSSRSNYSGYSGFNSRMAEQLMRNLSEYLPDALAKRMG